MYIYIISLSLSLSLSMYIYNVCVCVYNAHHTLSPSAVFIEQNKLSKETYLVSKETYLASKETYFVSLLRSTAEQVLTRASCFCCASRRLQEKASRREGVTPERQVEERGLLSTLHLAQGVDDPERGR